MSLFLRNTLKYLGVKEHDGCTYSQIVNKKIVIFVCDVYVYIFGGGRGGEGRKREGRREYEGKGEIWNEKDIWQNVNNW